ncbi:DNRLRE domain-containing protein [Streptomyces subrutilus]|uniref:DNRLRE domain-containing protein n=1 Tax=Streptomyces subrutilus TaxID=36818 RepID=UPI002E0F9094|nr:DNRLRE domain-containing protein [Streptomyces subrutilus]
MSVSSLQGTQPAFAAPQSERQGQAGAATATTAADVASARVAARLSGKRVEALSERTETSTTWANKNGSLTTEVSAGPIRFKDAQGQWRDVDVNLTSAADGSVVSKAHPQGLRLSGKKGTKAQSLAAAQSAAATDLVTLGQGSDAITLQWRGGLPAPVLDGTRATYADAVPGADVVVEATRTGFEQFVEVKAKPAANFSYTLPLKTSGLKVEQQQDGSVLFTDKKSKKTATMPAPVMWDATVDRVSGEHTRRAKVALKVVKTKDGVDLVVTPDAGFLADTATKYPVTVDPSTSTLGNLFDTYVQQGETVDWSSDTELDFGNPGTKNGDGTWRTARSFITWNTAPIADALVSDAKLSLWNLHSGNTDCTAQPWEVWTANSASTASRWTNQPAMVTKMTTSTETKGNPGCASAPDGWINADVTSLVQNWANNKWDFSGMGLRATDENNTKQWKRVNSANAATNPPMLTVTYNYRPRTGTKQEAGAPYFSYGGAYVVNTTTPVLRDTFIDANGDKVDGTFQIFDSATDTQVGSVLVSPWVSSGQVASVTVPAGLLTNGKTYKFRTSPYDGSHYNPGWSAWKTFTVDTAAPSAPTGLTSADYPSNAWVKGAGQAGNFTVTPPSGDHQWLEWTLDGTTWTKVETAGAAGVKTLTVAPPKDGTHTLQVRSVDKADNKSEAVAYTFHAGPGGFVQPSAGERTARRLPLEAEADGNKYDKVSFSWRRSEADAWTAIPAGHVTAGGTPLTAWPVALTAGKNAPLVWNATDTVNPDGTVQIKADFTGPGATGSTEPLSAVVDRNAEGAATQEVGPGTLNLLTGDFALQGSDVDAFGLAAMRSASSRQPARGAQEGQSPVFGKEWTAGITDQVTASDYTHIRKVSDTALDVVTNAGPSIHFTANTAQNAWLPEPGSDGLTLTGGYGSGFTLSDTAGTVTAFAKPDATATTWQTTTTLRAGAANSTTTVVSETLTANGKALARPKLVIAPTSAVPSTTCAASPSAKGCRVLEYVYATATTATSTALGDIGGQVKEMRLWATEPGAAAATSKAVQTYSYDDAGRLREAWNPQISPALKNLYEYDKAGRVTKLTAPGELPWTFTYGNAGAGSAAGDGMLLKAARSGLQKGTADVAEGTAATSIVYDVPITGTKAPYKLGAQEVKAWGQITAPTDATAVFPADSVPSSNDGASLTAADYKRARINYLGVSGRSSNTAAPGGHITTTEYDRFGNTVRALSASNRSVALGLTSADTATQADLGIAGLPGAERAALLSSTSVYSQDGVRLLEGLDPLRRVDLTADLMSGSTVLVPAGTSVTARPRTVNEYDAGRPTDGTATIKGVVTKTLTSAQVREHPTAQGETLAVQSVYDWVKGMKTQSIKDPAGLALTTTTEYDSDGRMTRQIQPGGTASSASTRVTTYWAATGTGTCKGRPEWAGLLCSTGPGGTITGGGSNPNQVPVTTSEYNWWGSPAKVTESANGVTRTTTTTYDDAPRPTKIAISGSTGQAVPDMTIEYNSASGRETKTTTAGGSVTKTFDKLGRQISYTDADGGATTTEYDLLDRPVKTADNVPSTTTYTYNHTTEPRGLPTATTDSVAGTFQATYNADGVITNERLPGGYTLNTTVDPAGSATQRTYTRDGDGIQVYADTMTRSVLGQAASHSGWSNQKYQYDKTGRLTEVEDTSETVCTRRAYGFDSRTNRISKTTAASAPGADCPGGGTTVNAAYDSADRLVDAGYTYDSFGRTTAKPGTGIEYFANDLVRRQTTGSRRQTWEIDPKLRFRSWTVETQNAGNWSQTEAKKNHYGDESDNPSWIEEDAAGSVITRNVKSLSNSMAATTAKSGGIVLNLSGIHGDVALQLPLDSAFAPRAYDSDEYGNARTATATAGRYAWLGAEQRSTVATSDAVLMGVRLYSPGEGRFLSVDPMFGGNANAYEYCYGDPVNCTDLSGKWSYSTWSRWWSPYKHVWLYLNRNETQRLAWGAGAVGGFFSAILPWTNGWVRTAFEILRAYSWYISWVAGSAMARSRTCVSIYTYVVNWWPAAPTAWHRRC